MFDSGSEVQAGCRYHGILPAVFLVSAVAIGWQLALMRCLLISKYHHFSFVIISCALLGFGAGGVLLSVWRGWFERHAPGIFRWATPGLGALLAICFRVGEALPLQVYFSPLSLSSTLGWWVVFWLVHCIPFLIAGLLIGLALMIEGTAPHRVYSVNLAGSAAGALGGILLMRWLPANGLVVPLSLSVILCGIFLIPGPGILGRRASPGSLSQEESSGVDACSLRDGQRVVLRSGSTSLSSESSARVRATSWKAALYYCIGLILVSLVMGSLIFMDVDRIFPLNVDEYKTLAYVQRLVSQGSAKQIATLSGPRGRIDLFSSPHFHTLLSLSAHSNPPPMDMILRDGIGIGSVLDIRSSDQARFLERALFALPYRLVQPKSVLVLGETGGLATWLARLSRASSIVVVQPDRNIVSLLESHPSKVLDDPRIRVVIAEPRAFLDSTELTFDLIQLTAMEGFLAGSAGIGGLQESYLATVEGFAQCLSALTPGGVTAVVRGIQDPPRDNIKIPATWIEALVSNGVLDPGSHLLMARDELSMITVAGRSPFSTDKVLSFRSICKKMSWDIEWLPGIRPEETNRVHVLPGPQGSSVSWLHYALARLLADEKTRRHFYRTWLTNITPATDDRPFFYDFFRWSSMAVLRNAFGPLWPTRSEMGFLLLLAAAVWSLVVGIVLLLCPLSLMARWKEAPSGSTLLLVIVYFAALGMAFMLLEMSFIQMFTRFLGDPVLAAALVVGGFLIFAGLGSLAQPRITNRLPGGVILVAFVAGLIAVLDSIALPILFASGALLSEVLKVAVGLLIIFPLAFLLGLPFPWGIALVHKKASAAVAIAWAVNGFASVVSASGAVLITMTYGFTTLTYVAAATYAVAGLLSLMLAGMPHTRSPYHIHSSRGTIRPPSRRSSGGTTFIT